MQCISRLFFFFFNDTATTEIYTLSLHDALPISGRRAAGRTGAPRVAAGEDPRGQGRVGAASEGAGGEGGGAGTGESGRARAARWLGQGRRAEGPGSRAGPARAHRAAELYRPRVAHHGGRRDEELCAGL